MKQPPESINDAAGRLFAGEEFYFSRERIYYDDKEGGSPFKVNGRTLDKEWHKFEMWEPIPKWHKDFAGDKIRLCWVSDDYPESRERAVYVEGYIAEGFESAGYIEHNPDAEKAKSWIWAVPVTTESLKGDVNETTT